MKDKHNKPGQVTFAPLPTFDDWAILKSTTDGVEFQVMDWAGTASLAIFPAGEIGDMDPQAALEEVDANMNSLVADKVGAAIGSFECGKNCSGDIYPVVSKGKPMHLFAALKLDGNELLMVHGGVMASLSERDSDKIKRIIESARLDRNP